MIASNNQSIIQSRDSGMPALPETWQVMTVDEIKAPGKKSIISGPFGSNISSKYFVDDGVPVVRGNNLSLGVGTKFKDDGFVYITQEKANELNTWASRNDLIFTAVGTIGQVGLLTGAEKYERYIISNKQLRLTLNCDIIDPFFAYYWFASDVVFNQIEQRNTGSSVPLINLSVLKSLYVPVPPIQEQKAIAAVLSSLYDKIDLLHRQNKTLEAMAETLFRQWFVEEVQADWEIRPLGDFVTVKRGGSPRPIQEYLSETGLRWLKISDATKTASPYIFDIKEHIKEEGLSKTTLLKTGTLVLSNSATPGIPKILQLDSCIHDGWLHFPKSHFSNEFLYLLFKKIRPELINQGNGSIFTNLKTDILKEYPIPIADDESLRFFDAQVKPLFAKLLKNATQIQTLEKLRDTLLPKLMSGEVRVEV